MRSTGAGLKEAGHEGKIPRQPSPNSRPRNGPISRKCRWATPTRPRGSRRHAAFSASVHQREGCPVVSISAFIKAIRDVSSWNPSAL